MSYNDPAQQRAYQREWLTSRRREFFTGKSCETCGATAGLELHHRDPDAKVDHRIWSWAAARFAAEVVKCAVLCASCHDRAHAEMRRARALLRNPHGTRNRYLLGCHCVLCRAGNREYNRSLKRRRHRMSDRTAWHVVIQDGESPADQDAEVVTLEGVTATPGATIDGTDGTRITFVEPASEQEAA